MDRSVKAGQPFFLWHNTTRMHVWTRLSPQWKDKSGYGLFADGLMELDWVVGELLKKLDELGIAQNTIVIFTATMARKPSVGPMAATLPSMAKRVRRGKGASACLASPDGRG